MLDCYPNLIESVIEFKVEKRKVLYEKKGQPYVVHPEDEQVDFSTKEYRLIKDPKTEYVYCCKHNQSMQERIKQK